MWKGEEVAQSCGVIGACWEGAVDFRPLVHVDEIPPNQFLDFYFLSFSQALPVPEEEERLLGPAMALEPPGGFTCGVMVASGSIWLPESRPRLRQASGQAFSCF